MPETSAHVFDSIESAHEYVGLLFEAVDEAAGTIAGEMDSPVPQGHPRHMEALRLADFKLKSLREHLITSRRLLNDLRTLRRYLFEERETHAGAAPRSVGSPR